METRTERRRFEGEDSPRTVAFRLRFLSSEGSELARAEVLTDDRAKAVRCAAEHFAWISETTTVEITRVQENRAAELDRRGGDTLVAAWSGTRSAGLAGRKGGAS